MNIIEIKNIIEINYDELKKAINNYICNNSEMLTLCPDTHITYNYPIILMNSETLNFLDKCIKNTKENKSFSMIFGCYIAIADWLETGKVELK